MIIEFNKLKYIVLLLAILSSGTTDACSMYKVSLGDKTMVGNNEDAWRTSPHIWFEIGKNGTYGCCFTGSREIGTNKYAAQSGMNEHGLTFSRLTSYHPEKKKFNQKNLKPIENPDQFLMDILRSCQNIDEVYLKLDQVDRSCFLEDVFVYVEPSGNYLVVEPYRLIRGSDPSYVQANFCPSITPEDARRKQVRYQVGRDMLNEKLDTSLMFCSNLSNKMHVCREKIGDGTLLTTIWNTKELKLNLFFYHEFTSRVSFDLMEELGQGDHQLEISSLFPENAEFEELKSYLTPFNTPWLRIVMALIGFFFLISALFLGVSAFWSSQNISRSLRLLLSLILLFGFIYLFILSTTIDIFYFPAPYESSSKLISIAVYLPYFISALVIVLLYVYWKKRNALTWNWFSKGLIFLNALALSGLFVGIFYWKLF